MKKILLSVLCVIIIFSVCACSQNEQVIDSPAEKVEVTENNEITESDKTEELLGKTPEEKDIITINSSADVIATKVGDVYELADLVVRAAYTQDVKVYAQEGRGAPITISEFGVLDVLKGSYDDDSIKAHYYGGVLSLKEYIQELDEASLQKAGYSYTDEEIQSKYITVKRGTPEIQFNDSDEYLLMLSYDPETDIYFILCDGYGAPVVKDGSVYNITENDYVDLTTLDIAVVNVND